MSKDQYLVYIIQKNKAVHEVKRHYSSMLFYILDVDTKSLNYRACMLQRIKLQRIPRIKSWN